MKSIHLVSLFILLALTAASSAQEAKGRTYKVGQVDKYKIQQTMSRPGLKHKSRAILTQKVVKVYENGDADIESTISDAFTTFVGTPESSGLPAAMLNKEGPTESDYKSVNRLNRFGALASGDPASELVITATQYALAGLKSTDIKVGQKIRFKSVESAAMDGVTTVKAIDGNAVTLYTLLDAPKSPLQLILNSKVDRSTFKILSLSGKLSGLGDKKEKDSFDTIEFSMTLVK